MSSIEELKDGTTSIDMTQTKRVDMSTGKTIVEEGKNEMESREQFDPRSIMPKKEEVEQPTVLESILEGPDSILEKYIEKRSNDMEERLSTFEEEKQAVEDGLDNDTDDEKDEMNSLLSDSNESVLHDTKTEDDVEMVQGDISDYDIQSNDIVNTETPESNNKDSSTNIKEEKKVESPELDVEVLTNFESDNTAPDTDDEIEKESDSEEIVDDTEESLNHLKALVTEKIKPISKKLDLSGFTIVKKASSSNNLIRKPIPKAAKWVLMNQETVVIMKEFTGSELQDLQEASENTRSLQSLTKRFRLIYDHILSPKPSSFEAWLKTTPFSDIDHYFFAIYISSYKGANFLPKDCKYCKETYLTDDVNIMSMTKFDSEELKAKFMDIYNNETSYSNSKGIYVAELVPVSENIAISFKEASIYNLFEMSVLDEKFRENYSDIVGYMPYIDTIYSIDQETKTLIPISYKVYPENATKTIKSKIKRYANFLRTLNSDEFSLINSYVGEVRKTESENKLRYIYPSSTCPKCGKEDEEFEVSAEEAVFTRYRLGALVNTSLN